MRQPVDVNPNVNVGVDINVNVLRRTWGEAVADRRRRLGLSQAKLGKACAVSQQTISKIERGLMVPLDHLKLRIAQSLATTPAALFQWPCDPQHRVVRRGDPTNDTGGGGPGC